MIAKVSMIGAGAWGTTLAVMISQNRIPVRVWAYKKETAEDINKFRENREFLPGIEIPSGVYATSDISEAVSESEFIIISSPSHTVRTVLKQLIPFLKKGAKIISVTKGIEEKTFATISEIITDELVKSGNYDCRAAKNHVAVISGPNLAREIAAGLPSTTVVASESKELRESVQLMLANKRFRVYTSQDVIGLELGGSLKNVIAIGAGICDGLNYGDNTKSAYLTRALREMIRIGQFKGANPETFYGLSGIGDLFATSYSKFSRNRTLGEKIALGNTCEQAQKLITGIAEGIHTAKACYLFGRKEKVELPVINEMYGILYEGKPPQESVISLMTRTLKGEME
ncbi:MAG: NAD(P)H-dependent glycerol-3-phosphate dehydrogenase [Candidatus Wallbacteria bacterium]